MEPLRAAGPTRARIAAWLTRRLGGRERVKVVAALASVMALDGADKGAVGAMAVSLQHAFGVGKTEIGLLLTVSLGMGAIATLPFGWLVDRVNRTRLLSWAVVVWGLAMALSALATSYLFLLLSRVALGGVTACAAPGVASLLGDYIPRPQRASVYGTVLAGEFLGTGLGLLLCGELGAWSWRLGFLVLVLPAFALAWGLRRLREPERGANDREDPGDAQAASTVQALARKRGIAPRTDRLIDVDPRKQSVWWAAAYVLKVPTIVVMIVASALAYFFLSGIRTFGVLYLHDRYGLPETTAAALAVLLGAGALVGVIGSGRFADRLIRKGDLRARVWVSAVAYLITCGLLLAALLVPGLWPGMLLLAATATALGGVNPPLDAARLDVMPPWLWGRAESIRIVLREAGEAVAPLIFGWLADGAIGSVRGAFLVMLVPLALGGLIGLIALRTYPRDVATAAENTRRADRWIRQAG